MIFPRPPHSAQSAICYVTPPLRRVSTSLLEPPHLPQSRISVSAFAPEPLQARQVSGLVICTVSSPPSRASSSASRQKDVLIAFDRRHGSTALEDPVPLNGFARARPSAPADVR